MSVYQSEAAFEAKPLRGGLAGWQRRKAMQMLDGDLAESGSLRIRDIAISCGLSFGHFMRAFRNATGTSPRQWLIARRVEMAKYLLEGTDEPLVEIAFACGFADQSHFSRTFVRHAGVTPGCWRRLRTAGPTLTEPMVT